MGSNYDSNTELCESEKLVSLHSQMAKQNYQKTVIYTTFTSNSDEYLTSLLDFLKSTPEESLNEFIEIKYSPESSIELIDKVSLSFDYQSNVLSTTMTFKDDIPYLEVTIRPKFFNLVESLPTVTLVERALLETKEINNTSNNQALRMLLLGRILNEELKELIEEAGGLTRLENLLNYRTTQYTESIILKNLQESMTIDFSKLLTIAYILGLLMKLSFISLILLAILGSFYGINIKSRILHYWVYSTVMLSSYFATNGYMAPAFRKFIEMIAIGWYSDLFEIDLAIQKLSSHFETVSYKRLDEVGNTFFIGSIFRFVVLIILVVSKLAAIKYEYQSRNGVGKSSNTTKKSKLLNFLVGVNKHMNTLGLLICLHILTSHLVDFKMSFNFMESNLLSIQLNRVMIFFSILTSQIYIILYAADFYKLMPEFRKLFTLSLFMRIDMGLGINIHRLRYE